MDSQVLFETKTHENKQILGEGDKALSWLKTICSFANTDGGTLAVGISDDFEAVGLKKEQVDKQVQLFLRETKEHLYPLPKFEFNYRETDYGTYILEIKVAKSDRLPVILTFHNVPSIYVRDEGRNSPADYEQIQNLVLSSVSDKFDLSVSDEEYDSRSYSLLCSKYLKVNQKELSIKRLVALRALNCNSKVTRGLKLFKDDFIGNETLIKVTEWKGLDKGADTYKSLYEGNKNLLLVLDESYEVIKANISSYEKKLADTRETIYDFPLRSIFEGLVNAFAHKNYFFSDTPIEVDIFPNRLEITSPGSLVNNRNLINEKDISDIQPTRRNEVICNLLSSLKYMEKEGSGFDKITQDYLLYPDIYKPFITSMDSYFKLTLPSVNSFGVSLDDEGILPVITPYDSSLNDRDKKILGYCYQKPRSIEEIAKKIGMKISTYLRKTILGNLVDKGLLKASSPSKATLYLSNKELVHIASQSISR